MNVSELQTALNLVLKPSPKLATDGVAGRDTRQAVDRLLKERAATIGSLKAYASWADGRRFTAAEQIIIGDAGIEVGTIDGLTGPQTMHAREVWQGRKLNNGNPVAKIETWRDDMDPEAPGATAAHNKWPKQRDVAAFYGTPDDVPARMQTILFPFPMRIAWEPTSTVHKTSVHKLCAQSFVDIWTETLAHYGHDRIVELRLDMFGGVYNKRKMRGGSKWSMHAYGCAEDIDPDRNQLKWHRNNAELDDVPYKDFWDIVYKHGGLSLGREKDMDWMHFQFTSDFS